MGRWAQRVRAGGTVNNFNRMISVTLGGSGSDQLTIEYANPIAANTLVANTFTSNPSGATGTVVNQVSANVVEIDLDADASGDTDVSYGGNTVGVVTPQTINY